MNLFKRLTNKKGRLLASCYIGLLIDSSSRKGIAVDGIQKTTQGVVQIFAGIRTLI